MDRNRVSDALAYFTEKTTCWKDSCGHWESQERSVDCVSAAGWSSRGEARNEQHKYGAVAAEHRCSSLAIFICIFMPRVRVENLPLQRVNVAWKSNWLSVRRGWALPIRVSFKMHVERRLKVFAVLCSFVFVCLLGSGIEVWNNLNTLNQVAVARD